MMLFLVPTFFLVFSIYALYDNIRSSTCDAKIHWEVATPFQLMLICVIATFTIPPVEEADLRLHRIRAELVCGLVLRQTV